MRPFPTSPFHLFLYLSFLSMGLLTTCGGGGGGTSQSGATTGAAVVTTTISDQPVCLTPNGPFSKVWVTITRVRANPSATAGPNDSGWVDLVDLRTRPVQVDLLNLNSTSCVLRQLGSNVSVAPGTFRQIRLFLLSNSPAQTDAVPVPNNCSTGFNCIITATGSFQPLLISGEAQSGIQIPSGQIAGGSFTLVANQTTNLNIDFDACSSVVQQANLQFRLKPVLRAGVLSATNTISGSVVDSLTHVPIPGAVVFAEQAGTTNADIDQVVAQTVTDSGGNFVLCALPGGNFDLVVVANGGTPGSNAAAFNPAVALQVPAGIALSAIPLVPSFANATIVAQVTVTDSARAPAAADLSISAFHPVGSSFVVIPPLANSTTNLPADSGAAFFSLTIPSGNPQVGTFTGSSTINFVSLSGQSGFQMNAQAFVPMSSTINPGAPDCLPSSLPIVFDQTSQIVVTPGSTSTQNFAFSGCQ